MRFDLLRLPVAARRSLWVKGQPRLLQLIEMMAAVERDQLGPAEVFHHLLLPRHIGAGSTGDGDGHRVALKLLQGAQPMQAADQRVAVAISPDPDRVLQPLRRDEGGQHVGIGLVIIPRPVGGDVDIPDRQIEDGQFGHDMPVVFLLEFARPGGV